MEEKNSVSWPAVLYCGFVLGILGYIAWETFQEQGREVRRLTYAHNSLAETVVNALNEVWYQCTDCQMWQRAMKGSFATEHKQCLDCYELKLKADRAKL